MERLVVVIGVWLTVALGASSLTHADYQKGQTAYEKGDYATALSEYRKAADKGNAKAQYNLGLMYSDGRGVTKDYKEAINWWKLAARQGVLEAQFNLGVMHENGWGATKDNIHAYMWYNIAIENGDKLAKTNRNIVEKKMKDVEISKAKTLVREWMRQHKK